MRKCERICLDAGPESFHHDRDFDVLAKVANLKGSSLLYVLHRDFIDRVPTC